ncbi:hypothetical protein V8J82_09875 [Gymnodinialimonas sp. 2305UL16-5]|uniref:hypothetical protein n=1 Tax=Gymnodinialimonas mytili TaxID=3126503 RepID=UPI0030A415E0
MTDATNPTAPLGVGAIISESFSILSKNFVAVVILAAIPTFIGLAVSGVLLGWSVALGTADPEQTLDAFAGPGIGITFGLSMIVQFAIYGLIVALLVQLAYNAKLGRPISVGEYFGPALSSALPIAILFIAISILASIGLVFLIIPGLWIYAVFFVTAPAVAIERVGFGGMGRSAELTKGYRWPIVGLFLVIAIFFIVLGFITQFLAAAIGGIVVALIITVFVNSIAYGISGIATALAYARLREIKEGVGVDDIVNVFE